MSESNCQCGRTHAKGCGCSCGGHENAGGEVAKPYKVIPDCDSGGWFVNGPMISRSLPKWVPPAREVADVVCDNVNEAYALGFTEGQREMRERVKEIEQRTRPDGDMADLAVNRLAQSILGEVKS